MARIDAHDHVAVSGRSPSASAATGMPEPQPLEARGVGAGRYGLRFGQDLLIIARTADARWVRGYDSGWELRAQSTPPAASAIKSGAPDAGPPDSGVSVS